MDDPIQANIERLLDEVMSMFTLFDSFNFKGQQLVRAKKLRAHYDRVRTKQLKELAQLDRLKLKVSTANEALECASHFRALLEKHTEQLNDIMSRLTDLMRGSLRDSQKKT